MAIGDNLQVGTGRGVTFAGVEFPNVSWSLSITSNVAAMHNARDGVNRKPTLEDCSGSVNGFYDTDAPPDGALANGEIGTIFLSTVADGSNGYTFLAILDNVQVDTNGQTEPMTVSFNFALQSGLITRPT